MQALINKPNWLQQVRETTATESLRCREPDSFPVAQVQQLTDAFVQASSRRSLTRREIAPCSPDCDNLLAYEISKLKNEAHIVHAAVLACLHVLTTPEALTQLRLLQPDFNNPDEHFDVQAVLYLQCLLITHNIRPRLFSRDEAIAAKVLLRIVVAPRIDGNFPSPSRVLWSIGHEGYSDLLPDDLIKVILQRERFKESLRIELEDLKAARRWDEAYQLVKSIRTLLNQPQQHQRNRAAAIIPDVFPEYATWAAWQPSRRRIKLWKDRIPEHYWTALAPVFDLEGPDITGHQRGTIRHSSAYFSTDLPGFSRLSSDVSILERILKLLDRAANLGPESVGLFVYLCIESGPPDYQALERLKLVLEAASDRNADSESRIMKEYLKKIKAPPNERILALTEAIPIIGRTQALQNTFSTDLNLKWNAVDTLSVVRMEFCTSLRDSTPCESFGHSIIQLGRTMLAAEWLHEHWHGWYIDNLRQIPSHGEIKAVFQDLHAAQGLTREYLIEYLGSKVGNCSRRSQSVLVGPDAPLNLLMMAPQDPIWYVTLDRDRDRLRCFIKTVPGMTSAIAVACLKRSRHEHTTFVRTLMGILLDCTDQVCINLANFLGSRILRTQFKVEDCWKTLLLHMMRQQPPGMVERVARLMDLVKWQNWTGNMRRIFGDRHLDPHGGLGITPTKISGITVAKMDWDRSPGTNSSTDSEGFFS